MIAADSSSLVAYLSGQQGPDVDAIDRSLVDQQLCLPPVVLTELLSDPNLPNDLAVTLRQIPLLEITDGFWDRSGALRARMHRAEETRTACRHAHRAVVPRQRRRFDKPGRRFSRVQPGGRIEIGAVGKGREPPIARTYIYRRSEIQRDGTSTSFWNPGGPVQNHSKPLCIRSFFARGIDQKALTSLADIVRCELSTTNEPPPTVAV